MQQLVASLLELPCRPTDRCRVHDVELDAYLRDRPRDGPSRRPEARLGGLGQRPDAEGLAPVDLLAVVIVVAVALERQPESVDVKLATGGRVGRDPRHGREERYVHPTSSLHCTGSTIQAACANRATS